MQIKLGLQYIKTYMCNYYSYFKEGFDIVLVKIDITRLNASNIIIKLSLHIILYSNNLDINSITNRFLMLNSSIVRVFALRFH